MDEALTWNEFERVDLRAGTVVEVEPFPEARVPAWKLLIDFGPRIGRMRSSARITDLYGPEDLVGRQVIAVVNFPPKQIGPVRSECLVTGFPDAEGRIVLAGPERAVPDGARLC